MIYIIGLLHVATAGLLGYYAIQDYYDRRGVSGDVIYQSVMAVVIAGMGYWYLIS